MEQHPIPQQISSYEFKLVGDMTLKQFLKAAIGIILAILINTTKLIVLVKWPLMFVVAGGGLLLAFVPFEDRPLETWIVAFIKSIYSPTIYIYKKRADKNWLELDSSKTVDVESNENEEIVLKKDSKKIDEFVQSLPSVKRENKKLEEKETKEEAVVKETDWRDQKSNLNLKTEKLEATGQAVFGSIPMPDIPETPNVIVGMATDGMGKIVDGVIIEIQDEHGNPTRVLKSNSLGQFKTSTPLSNGRYLLICEKEGFNFDRVNVDLKGEIVKPIRIITSN
ncbi:MAG: carboxypeptidase-like regulatory domain-containing protein [Candidatus Shapirobacteria bacterium]